jgi:hypothetical protein
MSRRRLLGVAAPGPGAARCSHVFRADRSARMRRADAPSALAHLVGCRQLCLQHSVGSEDAAAPPRGVLRLLVPGRIADRLPRLGRIQPASRRRRRQGCESPSLSGPIERLQARRPGRFRRGSAFRGIDSTSRRSGPRAARRKRCRFPARTWHSVASPHAPSWHARRRWQARDRIPGRARQSARLQVGSCRHADDAIAGPESVLTLESQELAGRSDQDDPAGLGHSRGVFNSGWRPPAALIVAYPRARRGSRFSIATDLSACASCVAARVGRRFPRL